MKWKMKLKMKIIEFFENKGKYFIKNVLWNLFVNFFDCKIIVNFLLLKFFFKYFK